MTAGDPRHPRVAGDGKHLSASPATLANPLSEVTTHAALRISDRNRPLNVRIRLFWSYAKAARDLGATDVIQAEFLELARTTCLAADLGRHVDEDLRHVLGWAARGLNPFEAPK
jgi:hypothetical protein